jgi:type IV pilus assembly protein PilN
MIRINLLPLKETERAIGRRQQMSLIALGASVALLIMVVPFVVQGRRLANLDRDIHDVQEQIRRYNDQVKEVRDLESLKKELETKLRIIEDLNDKRVGPAHVLADLSSATPDNSWLMSFNEKSSSATLTGMALDNETIARFMRQLQTSPYFYGVDLVETSKSAPAQMRAQHAEEPGPTFTRFIVKAGIDYFGRGGKKEPEQKEAAKPTPPSAGKGQK